MNQMDDDYVVEMVNYFIETEDPSPTSTHLTFAHYVWMNATVGTRKDCVFWVVDMLHDAGCIHAPRTGAHTINGIELIL